MYSYSLFAQSEPRCMVGATCGLMTEFAKSVNEKVDVGPGGSLYATWRVGSSSGLSLSAQYQYLRSTFGAFNSHEDVEAQYGMFGVRFDVANTRDAWVPYLATAFGFGKTTNFVREVWWDTTSKYIQQTVSTTAITFAIGCNVRPWQKSGITTEFRTFVGEDSGLTLGLLTGYFIEF
ncbi:MAG: hypothetical protein U0Y96_05285 [Candidatus Kapaibacterium sp.]|nr:hypothetical protein [Bacteroidota bacterium]